MLSPHFQPVDIDGYKFDKGMILYEFIALREPERTQFPQIGEWVKSRIPMNQIPTPQMYWQGRLWPDMYIANQLPRAFDVPNYGRLTDKRDWPDDFNLQEASLLAHGKEFHELFIEPMCRKITGRGTADIAAKYNRAIWLPLYWPQTLRAGQSLPTPFWYPKAGYAGAILGDGETVHDRGESAGKRKDGVASFECTDISITFVLAKPRTPFSVLFVVDDSPIYRITDMDVCAGIEAPLHRLIVEYRGECAIWHELHRMGLAGAREWAYGSARLQLPTLSNVAAGWTPRPHINAQLWSIINDET